MMESSPAISPWVTVAYLRVVLDQLVEELFDFLAQLLPLLLQIPVLLNKKLHQAPEHSSLCAVGDCLRGRCRRVCSSRACTGQGS